MQRIFITGGSGFIGSFIAGFLNRKGVKSIYIVDDLDKSEKWKNLVNKDFIDYIDKDIFLENLIWGKLKLKKNDIIIHMGACSSTTELDSDFLMNNNAKYTYSLFNICQKYKCSFIYASSAATYGNGDRGYSDFEYDLSPLNMYGYTKYLTDKWIIRDTKDFKELNSQVVGLKFFNVFGPNEYHKGSMSSVVYHGFNQIKSGSLIKLFKSYKKGIDHGQQMRDFIYIYDVAKIVYFFMQNPNINGIFNLGTGKARSFYDLAVSVFDSLKIKKNIEFIEMPEGLKEKYQYFTEAKMDKLKKAGYKDEFYSLEKGIDDYVKNYLERGFLIY